MMEINTRIATTELSRKLCEPLKLKSIKDVHQKMSNKKVRGFDYLRDGVGLGIGRQEVYYNGYLKNTCVYQLQIITEPNQGIFEATVKVMSSGMFHVQGDISRVDRYGDQSKCIEQTNPSLREFCLCRT